jgi:hypothetical protein
LFVAAVADCFVLTFRGIAVCLRWSDRQVLTQEGRLIRKHLPQDVTGVDIEMASRIRLQDTARRFPRNVDRQLRVGLGVLLGDAAPSWRRTAR